jgi:thymidylate synthase
MISSPYTLKYLKKLGYKTFNKWWDESYDDELDLDTRLNMIIKILEDLNKKSEKELVEMLEEMRPIIEHNHNTWRKRIHPKQRRVDAITEIISSIDNLSLDGVLDKHEII